MGSPTAEFDYCVILWQKHDEEGMLSRPCFVDTVRVGQVQDTYTTIYRPLFMFCFDYHSCNVQITCTLISGYAWWHQRAKPPPKTDVIKKIPPRAGGSSSCTLGYVLLVPAITQGKSQLDAAKHCTQKSLTVGNRNLNVRLQMVKASPIPDGSIDSMQ